MCGIVGVFRYAKNKQDIPTAQALAISKLLIDAGSAGNVRGVDSTGILCIDQAKNEYYSQKKVMHGTDFVQLPTIKNTLLNWEKWDAVVMHHRWATVGGISRDTAHPHHYGNTFLVHNGTLTGYISHKYSEVGMNDSQTLTNVIDNLGPQGITEMSGPMALVWYSAGDKILHLYRNKDRPLAMATFDGGLLFASEMGMLKWLCERNDVEIKSYGELKVDTHLTLSADKEIKAEIIKSKEPTATTSTTWNSGWTGKGSDRRSHNYSSNDTWGPRPSISEILNDYIHHSNGHLAKNPKAITNLGFSKGDTVAFYPTMVRTAGQRGGEYVGGYGVHPYASCIVVSSISNHKERREFNNHANRFEGTISRIYVHPKSKEKILILSNVKKYSWAPVPSTTPVIHLPVVTTENQDNPDDHKTVRGPDGQWLSVKEFKALTKHGCSYCSADISILDSDELAWLHGEPLCKDCHHVLPTKTFN